MAQGPQLRPKKGKSLDFGVIAIVILLIVGIFIFMRNITGRPDELSYTDFKEYVEDGRIQSVTVTPVGGENIGLDNITGEYIDEDGNKAYFSVIIDREDFKANFQPNLIAQGVEINYNKLTSSNWLSIITFLLPIVLFIGLMVFLLRNTNAGNNRAFDFGKTRAKLSRHSKTTFKDVAGVDEEKEELEEVIDFLNTQENTLKLVQEFQRNPTCRTSWTGKTYWQRLLQAEIKFHSSHLGSDSLDVRWGGASRVRDMFKNAKQAAPCIVFIDEIDAVGRQRGAGLGGGHDEREQTLNQLLVEMDGFEENSGVIVMAATNRVDVLDPALLRPGRFDRQIRISNPDVRGRTEILKVHARNKKISPKVNLEEIAKRTPGFSGADLENLLNEAALLAAREGRKEIKIYDIDEAIDRVLMGPAKKSRKYSLQEKRIVSYHEAGHAVIGIKLETDVVQKVTIVPRGEVGGYNLMTPEEERFYKPSSLLTISLVYCG